MTGGPLREVRVVVPNRPGVIADLALTLSRAGINIHDMSLSPQPDFRSGEVALWVADDHAERARELVEEVAGMTTVNLRSPAKRLRGTVAPPADKSISHRAAILGAMAAEPVRVRNYLHAEDTMSTLNAMRALGALVDRRPTTS